MIDVAVIKSRFEAVSPFLDERGRRLVAASEALAAGHGGIQAVSAATAVARSTIGRGLAELRGGATDLGGLSANGDHISPEHPFPSPHEVRKRLKREGFALTERLCVYPQYIDPYWIAQGVLDAIKLRYWSFIPRRGSGRRRAVAIRSDLVSGAIEKARDGRRLSADELTALFAERRPQAV